MKRTNILSTILVIIFMISCISFFNADANEEVPSEVVTEAPTVAQTEPITEAPATEAPTTEEPATENTTIVTESTTYVETESTTYATVADPVYTETTKKTKKTTTTTAEETTEAENEATEPVYYQDATKETKEIKPTEATEPTTPKKNITNYGSKFRPLKWISFVLMLGSAAALVFVNVRYKKLHGKPSKSNVKKNTKLDTSAKFTTKQPKYESEAIDLSSFSKRKTSDDENKLKNDDDLYI